MILGERLKQAIESSGFSNELIASKIGMSATNLYRLFKKETFEIKYLVQIAEFLQLPLSYFLNDETLQTLTLSGSGNMVQQAHQVKKNHQQISMGGADECQQQLQTLQEKYELQQQLLAEKERTIEILIGKK